MADEICQFCQHPCGGTCADWLRLIYRNPTTKIASVLKLHSSLETGEITMQEFLDGVLKEFPEPEEQ